jgi:uncharacterized protein (UPF0276 family)
MTMAPAPANKTGIGLRTPHYRGVLSARPDVGFVEVHSENYFGDGGQPLAVLERVSHHYPISLHGVGLSLGSTQPLNQAHLRKLKALSRRFDPWLVSEHLAWVGADGIFLNDLLPLPYTEESFAVMAMHVTQVQDALGRRILIENPSSYIAYKHSTINEAEFLARLAAETGCGLLLDVNNVYVSACNHGFDAAAYLRAIPSYVVEEFHLAGHAREDGLLIDTHDRPVSEAVWKLYRLALHIIGDRPTLIERDSNIPALQELVDEAAYADGQRRWESTGEAHDARAA